MSKKQHPTSDEQLLATSSLADKPIGTAMVMAAKLVDLATDRRSEPGLLHAINLIEQLRKARKDTVEEPELSYFLANAWEGLCAIRRTDDRSIWVWKQPERKTRLLCLREAAQSRHFQSLRRGRQTQVLTNMGNLLSFVGRSFDAVRFYDRALAAFQTSEWRWATEPSPSRLLHAHITIADRRRYFFIVLTAISGSHLQIIYIPM